MAIDSDPAEPAPIDGGMEHGGVPIQGGRPAATGGGGSSPAGIADAPPVWRDHQNVRAAAKFVGRVAQLDIAAIRAAVATWRAIMRAESDTWFMAEAAAGRAVLATGRSAPQERLLGEVAMAVLHGVWYRRGLLGEEPPETRVDATEASGQYVASVALVAVLVSDELEAAQFELLYLPFALTIPVEELERE
jgi:hypothetical protein